MIVKSITNTDLFKIIDEDTKEIFYGCNQEWYATDWQRRAGCGPCVASNIIFYLNNEGHILEPVQNGTSKKSWLSLMEEAWENVTPTQDGIPETKMFYELVSVYTKLKGLKVDYKFCDLPKDNYLRPTFSEILEFLEGGLTKEVPIAFLNLSNGEEVNLEPWHWVTIVSLEYLEDGRNAFIKILDEGLVKKINLRLWYHTTTLGGGFVYFIVTK